MFSQEVIKKMLEKIIEHLKNANMAAVRRGTKLNLGTLYSIRDGKNENPRIKTVEKLAEYFKNMD